MSSCETKLTYKSVKCKTELRHSPRTQHIKIKVQRKKDISNRSKNPNI